MPALDPKKEKANIALIKTALRKAAMKSGSGDPIRVGFAFAPSPKNDRKDHLLLIDPRKKALQLLQQITKEHKDRKQLCSGTAAVIKEGGKYTVSIKFIKKLTGAERKMQEAFKAMSLPQYKVVLEKVKDDEEVEDVQDRSAEEDEELENATRGHEDEDELETAHASADDEDEDEKEDEDEEEDARSAAGEDEDEEEDESEDEDSDDEREDAEEDVADAEKEVAAAQDKLAAAKAKLAQLEKAPAAWHQTRGIINKKIDALRAAIKKEYANEAPELNAEIDKGIAQMNRIMDRLDHRLADQMELAHKAKDEASRKAELAKCKTILAEHIKYIQSEPLIAHIDSNPFGVKTDVKPTLMAVIPQFAKIIS